MLGVIDQPPSREELKRLEKLIASARQKRGRK